MFASCLFFGNFAGPTMAGFLVQYLSFPMASLIFWVFYLAILCMNASDLVYHMKIKATRTAASGYEQMS